MKKIIVLILLAGLGLYAHLNPEILDSIPAVPALTDIFSPSGSMSFEHNENELSIADKEIEYRFTPRDTWEREGKVANAEGGGKRSNRFIANTMDITQDETAFELSKYATNDQRREHIAEFSPQAQRVIQTQDAARYVEAHAGRDVYIAQNAAIDRALRGVQRGDTVTLKGYIATFKSGKYQDTAINESANKDYRCVNRATINDQNFE